MKSWTSNIVFKYGLVVKTVKPRFYPRFNVFINEIKWLSILKYFNRSPDLIYYNMNKKIIVMSNMGEVISRNNIPDDWELQIKYISDGLKYFGCAHNDIKPSEILVKDKKINIIDFGWSTRYGEKIPEEFPPGLGDKFKYKEKEFNDYYSLNKSILYVLNDGKED